MVNIGIKFNTEEEANNVDTIFLKNSKGRCTSGDYIYEVSDIIDNPDYFKKIEIINLISGEKQYSIAMSKNEFKSLRYSIRDQIRQYKYELTQKDYARIAY